jgi:formate hydrogenlyase subunit 3/multisubunit Na+/H+ antiporter MnhD subunit
MTLNYDKLSFYISIILLIITIIIFFYQQKILKKNEKIVKLFASNVLNKLKK